MKKFIILMVCLLILTGCSAKLEYNMGVNEDKSVSFGINIGFDEELLNVLMSMDEGASIVGNYTDEEQWEFLKTSLVDDVEENPLDHGFSQVRFEKEGFKGYTLTKTIASIDDITGDNAHFSITNDYINISKSKVFQKEGNTYVSKIVFNELDETEEYGINQQIEVVVTLPNKPISHNATSVSEDGKTLTWILSSSESGTIDFKFEIPSFPYVLVLIGVLAGIGVIAGVIIIVSLTKKKNNRPVNVDVQNDNENINMSFSFEQPVADFPPVQTSVDNQPINNDFIGMNYINDVVGQNNQSTSPIVESVQTVVEPPVSEIVDISANNAQSELEFSFDEVVAPIDEVILEPALQVETDTNQPNLQIIEPITETNVVVPSDESMIELTPSVPVKSVDIITPDIEVPEPVAVTDREIQQDQNENENVSDEQTFDEEKIINIIE